MAEYINREELLKDIEDSVRFSTRNGVSAELRGAHKIVDRIRCASAYDVVEVVRCSDCKWFVPKYIKLNDGTIRAYTEEEKKLPLGVTADIGINCGSRCLRCLRWEENSIPVYVQENDYCSYGERRSENES